MPFHPFALETRIGGLEEPNPLPEVVAGGACPDAGFAACCASRRNASEARAALVMNCRRVTSIPCLRSIVDEKRASITKEESSNRGHQSKKPPVADGHFFALRRLGRTWRPVREVADVLT